MPTTIEIKGLLEEKMELLLKTGLYASKSEIVRDGLRKLLENQDFLAIAISLYRKNEISTGRAAEISNLAIAEFVNECQKRKVPLAMGIDDVNELENEMTILRKLRNKN